jgi:hypothetical protein
VYPVRQARALVAVDSHYVSKPVPWLVQKLVSLATMSTDNHPRAARLVGDIVCQRVAAPNHKGDPVKALIDDRIVWDCVSACRYIVGKAVIGKLEEHKELLMSMLRILNVVAVVSAGSRELVKLEMDAHATVLLVLSRRSEPRDLQILLMKLLYPIWWRHASLRAMIGCVHDLIDMLRETTSPNEKTAAANALAAACKDTSENIELVPVVELLAICEEMLRDGDHKVDQHAAALRLVTSLAADKLAWETPATDEIVAHVLRLLEHGAVAAQIEATYAVVALVTMPSCRKPLLENANVESLLDAITSDRVRPWAQQAKRRWSMGVHCSGLLAPMTKTNDDPFAREVDGFCLIEMNEWSPSDDEDDEDEERKRELRNLMDRFRCRHDSTADALLTLAREVAETQLEADDLVRFGVVDLFFEPLTAALRDPLPGATADIHADSRYDFMGKFEAALASSPLTAAGLCEILRGVFMLIQTGDYSRDRIAVQALRKLVGNPHMGRLLLQADVVRFCTDVVSESTRRDALHVEIIKLLCDLAREAPPALVLDSGAPEALMVMYGTVEKRKASLSYKGIRKQLRETLVSLARRHRAVQAIVFANPQLVAVKVACLSWTPNRWLHRPSRQWSLMEEKKKEDQDEDDETFLAIDTPTAMDPTAVLEVDSVSQVVQLRRAIDQLNDPVERTQLLGAGLEAKLTQAQGSSDSDALCVWARAASFWLRVTAPATVESLVVAYLEGDTAQKQASLNTLLTMEISQRDTAVSASVFALCVGCLHRKDTETRALELLLYLLDHDAPVALYYSSMASTQRGAFLGVLLAQVVIPTVCDARVLTRILQLLREISRTHVKTRLQVSDKLLAYVDVMRSGALEEQQLAAASLVVSLLDGHSRSHVHRERRNLVVAMGAGLVQAFMAVLTSVASRESVAVVLAQVADKLRVMQAAHTDQSMAASQCLTVLFRALLFHAKTTTSDRASLAIELLVQWSQHEDVVRSLAGAGAITVAAQCLELQLSHGGGEKERTLGAVGLKHALALVERIAAVADLKAKLTEGEIAVVNGLKRLQESAAITPEMRSEVLRLVDRVLGDRTTEETTTL